MGKAFTGLIARDTAGRVLGRIESLQRDTTTGEVYALASSESGTSGQPDYGLFPLSSVTMWDDEVAIAGPDWSEGMIPVIDPESLKKFTRPLNTLGNDRASAIALSAYILSARKILVEVNSSPPEAQVIFDDLAFGRTNASFSVKSDRLPDLILRKKGYRDCSYSEGRYRFDNGRGIGHFNCSLHPVSADD